MRPVALVPILLLLLPFGTLGEGELLEDDDVPLLSSEVLGDNVRETLKDFSTSPESEVHDNTVFQVHVPRVDAHVRQARSSSEEDTPGNEIVMLPVETVEVVEEPYEDDGKVCYHFINFSGSHSRAQID